MRELFGVLQRAVRWALIPFIAAAIASFVMLVQGGFGGGHRPLDWLVGGLGLPSILFLEYVRIPKFLLYNDFLLIALFPALINAVLWFGGALLVLTVKACVRPVA